MPKTLCGKPFHTIDDAAGNYLEAIEAEEFRLVDKNGNARAVLGLGDKEQPCLLLFDENEKQRVSVFITDGQPRVELLDKDEKARIAFGLGDKGQPSLLLLDTNEKVHAALEMGEDGGAGLDLYDADEELRATFSLSRDTLVPPLALVGKDGQHRKINEASTGSAAAPLLVLYDKDGEVCDMLGAEYDDGSA